MALLIAGGEDEAETGRCTLSYNILYTGILTNIILSYKISIYNYFYEQLFEHTGILLNRYFDKQVHHHTVI